MFCFEVEIEYCFGLFLCLEVVVLFGEEFMFLIYVKQLIDMYLRVRQCINCDVINFYIM